MPNPRTIYGILDVFNPTRVTTHTDEQEVEVLLLEATGDLEFTRRFEGKRVKITIEEVDS